MKSKKWDGEGIPPIGTVCEYRSEDGKWRKCEIVAYYLANVVAVDLFDSTAVCLHSNLGLFRLVRTPKQLKVEERNLAIDEMLDLVGRYSIFKNGMGKLYDAGYRKTE